MSSCTSPDEPTVVTYWMNRLQGHASPQNYMVTLNARERINAADVIEVMDYEHPIYTPEAVAAQSRHAEVNRAGTYFCGAYWRNGFHEDGVRSGMRVAEALGVPCL